MPTRNVSNNYRSSLFSRQLANLPSPRNKGQLAVSVPSRRSFKSFSPDLADTAFQGFFPNAGQDIYLIGSPAYTQTTLHFAEGKTFTIEACNLSPENIYGVTASLNGNSLNRSWLHHNEIVPGGRLVLTMSKSPTQWAAHNPPPSTPPEPKP